MHSLHCYIGFFVWTDTDSAAIIHLANRHRDVWVDELTNLTLLFLACSLSPWLTKRPRRGPLVGSSEASMLLKHNKCTFTDDPGCRAVTCSLSMQWTRVQLRVSATSRYMFLESVNSRNNKRLAIQIESLFQDRNIKCNIICFYYYLLKHNILKLGMHRLSVSADYRPFYR